jgi:glycosyltransferase involved in cell wall biosynthesis
MRILLLTETIPYPLDSGGRIKTYHTLQMLSREHEVHCFAFVRSETQRAHLSAIREVCASVTLELLPRSPMRELGYVARGLRQGLPYTVLRHFEPASLAAIRRVLQRGFDVVYADHLSMMEYARRLGVPIVHDAHNVEFEILRRYASTRRFSPLGPLLAWEWRRVGDYERLAYAESDLVLAVSDADAQAIRRLAGKETHVHVIPISVDACAVQPVQELTREPRLLFVGGLHWPPNLDALVHFARDVWPLIRQAVPAAQLTVVGRDDVSAARFLRRTPGFMLTGYVEDVGPHFDGSRAMVVPLRAGSGMRVKILEAFARGLPVVSTPTGHEGLDVEPGSHLLSAAEPPLLAREAVRLMTDDELARRIAIEARRLVEKKYDVRVVGRGLLEAIRTLDFRSKTAERRRKDAQVGD